MVIDGDKKREKRPRRAAGPPILMTDHEYASVKRMASFKGRPLSSYLRVLALTHRLETNYTRKEINRVRSAGRRLNHLVHRLHIDPTIIYGARRPGLPHYDDVMKELYILEEVLRGAGGRVLRGIVRCTPAEHEQIRARAERAGMTQSAFIRALALNRPIGKKTHYDMVDQLERLENNLGQLMGVEAWNYYAGQRINLLMQNIDRRIRELTSGRKRREVDT